MLIIVPSACIDNFALKSVQLKSFTTFVVTYSASPFLSALANNTFLSYSNFTVGFLIITSPLNKATLACVFVSLLGTCINILFNSSIRYSFCVLILLILSSKLALICAMRTSINSFNSVSSCSSSCISATFSSICAFIATTLSKSSLFSTAMLGPPFNLSILFC